MIWSTCMYNGEDDMLLCRMEAFADAPCEVRHVFVERPHTHRGVPKRLTFPVSELDGDVEFRYIIDHTEPDPAPWVNEHSQRNAAWTVIDTEADDSDVVLIADLDEIPSEELLAAAAQYGTKGPYCPVSVALRLFLFAVDWESPAPPSQMPQPVTLAPVGWLREAAAAGHCLAEVRDAWRQFPRLGGEAQTWGWHFSWVGGPERQRAKLETATCHVEILDTPEADLIRSGARWRTAEDGGGLPVVPVDVDSTWPAYVHERRCPANWFRPRDGEMPT